MCQSITSWTLLNAALCASSILFWLSIVKGLEHLQAEGFPIEDFLQLAWYIASLLNKTISFTLVSSSKLSFFLAISWIVPPPPNSKHESPYVHFIAKYTIFVGKHTIIPLIIFCVRSFIHSGWRCLFNFRESIQIFNNMLIAVPMVAMVVHGCRGNISTMIRKFVRWSVRFIETFKCN